MEREDLAKLIPSLKKFQDKNSPREIAPFINTPHIDKVRKLCKVFTNTEDEALRSAEELLPKN